MIIWAALALLDWLAGLLPSGLLYRLARWAGWLSLPVFERQRLAVRSNIMRLHPEWPPGRLDTAVRGVFDERARYYVDLALFARRSSQEIFERHLRVEGLGLLQDAVSAGKGVVLAGSHLSNPEVPFQALAALGIDAVAMVEPIVSRRQMGALQKRRQLGGLRFVPATMEGVREAIALLRRGGLVAVLSDRDIQGGGVCLPFAGRLARFPTGAVDLAMRTDAALLIGLAIREHDDHFRVLFLPTDPLIHSDNRALDVRANLASLIRRMEPLIVEHADQWRVFESPWKPCRDTPFIDRLAAARPREPGSDVCSDI